MLEMMINPRKAEKKPWKMLFIGILYGTLSLLLVQWLFSADAVLSKFSGIFVVLFSVMFTLPFMYYIIKIEEREDENVEGLLNVWKRHKDAIYSFMWLFLGFVLAFSFWNIVLSNSVLLNAQTETYCLINSPSNFEGCVQNQNSILDEAFGNEITGNVVGFGRFLAILQNNVYVMIFTLVFSLIFGAGAIFILAWNASVIASAIGIFTKYSLIDVPLGLSRYMIHGIPEITAYFITALAGGMFGVGFLRHGFKSRKFMRVVENVILLLFVSLVILILAGLVEVYITPKLFS